MKKTAKQKTLEEQLRDKKTQELQKFTQELQELMKKYNCTLEAQAILSSNQINFKIIPKHL